jgi:hypothetical protein
MNKLVCCDASFHFCCCVNLHLGLHQLVLVEGMIDFQSNQSNPPIRAPHIQSQYTTFLWIQLWSVVADQTNPKNP